MKEERDSNSGFSVTDRRKFNSEGELREEPMEEESSAAEEKAEPAMTKDEAPPEASTPEEEVPALDFSSFILSLATTAMVHMGEVPDPATGQAQENHEAAKQMIDILSMLEKKTEGNLTEEETRLMAGILYELRMKFLSRSSVIQP
jgi:hypothetical protein